MDLLNPVNLSTSEEIDLNDVHTILQNRVPKNCLTLCFPSNFEKYLRCVRVFRNLTMKTKLKF